MTIWKTLQKSLIHVKRENSMEKKMKWHEMKTTVGNQGRVFTVLLGLFQGI